MKRRKVATAALMLIVTLVALTTATYAWFSSNTTATLNGLDVNVTAAEGIQVSTDAETWKAEISVEDITTNAYTGHNNQLPSVLVPVSTIGSQTVGNFEMFNGALQEGATTTLDTVAASAETAGTTGDYIAFDIFIKSATTEDIWLETGSGVVDGATSVGLEYAPRVAFFDQGTDGTSTPATAIALATGTSASQTIWEPNALTHTTYALANGATAGTKMAYYGIKAAGTGLSVDLIDQETDANGTAVNFGNVTTITPDTDTTQFEMVAGNVIFDVDPGITKVRVYAWIEGQDIDCENSISLGADDVTINIIFKKQA